MRTHGTRSKYSAGCHCAACRKANTEYESRRVRHAAYRAAGGEPPIYVDAEPVRECIGLLRSDGLGKRRIAAVSGVSTSAIGEIVNGRRTRVRRETAEAILAVSLAAPADGALVGREAVLAAIERLRSRGWRRYQIAAALGCKTPALQIGNRERVKMRSVRRLLTLERLAAREAPGPDNYGGTDD